MKVWFTSDTHFSHTRIIELCKRPFSSIEQMNEMMVANWNEVVSNEDHVYHLGDLCLGKFDESIKYAARLNGTKFLIPGNHDRVSSCEKMARRQRFLPMYQDAGFIIYPEITMMYLEGVELILSHYPFSGDSQEQDRFNDIRPIRQGIPLVHGHVHDKWRINADQFNVGVDVNDFRPVAQETILEWARNV